MPGRFLALPRAPKHFPITRRAFSCRISSESNSETGELTDPQLRRRIPKLAKMSVLFWTFSVRGGILTGQSGSSAQYRILEGVPGAWGPARGPRKFLRLRAAWICPAKLAHISADRLVLVCGVPGRPSARQERCRSRRGESEASGKPPKRCLDTIFLTGTGVNDKLGCVCVAGWAACLDASWHFPGLPNTFQ